MRRALEIQSNFHILVAKKVAKKVATCAKVAKKLQSNMLDMCNYFFSNFLKSYKMSVAKVKVAQNRHVCDQSERKLQAMLYML